MKILINGRNIPLTDAIKNYALEKFDRLDHHFDFIQEIHVFLSVEKNPRVNESQKAEATIHVNRAVLRVEVSSQDLYGSIDLLVDKIDRSLQKHKTKLLGRAKSAKAEPSIRKAEFERAVEAEQHVNPQDELEGIFLTYVDDAEEVVSAYPKV
ncbi:MAG: ribosome-associated translation inhibitor RaiA [Vampirovibrionales bacterium]|nr:ribosome-associated translation inhibitor RaiA [Vampirovibrionales bacterium]